MELEFWRLRVLTSLSLVKLRLHNFDLMNLQARLNILILVALREVGATCQPKLKKPVVAQGLN